MDVLLLKDVKSLGGEGDIVRVKPGYARNFLVPSGVAIVAEGRALKNAQELSKQRKKKAQRVVDEAKAVAEKMAQKNLVIKLAVGDDDKPFGSVTVNDIRELLAKEGFSVDRHAITLDKPIKTLGAFEIPVKLQAQVTASVKLAVVKEE